ncbi:hypothetical protein CBR_g40447 [Chara braunii]|uniref:Reverse transcriptase domain-containing protein n=1 Tax=Chara braunii TaxID=69332 RepID=A0A388LTY4_CHABU|nr:hypothetical protein CBR_g40447 [Chara braunii]|eukprot:GBG85719.1 hypothetical protein CBR_g40447 [Chara braunii]
MEKKISEWVANLSLGEEEEVAMYIPKDEQEVAMKKWEAEEDVLTRRAMEDEQRMAWKLAVMREKKRRVEAANAAMQELAEVRTALTTQLTPQVDLQRKVEIIAESIDRLAKMQEKHYEFSRSHEISVRVKVAAPKEEKARPSREPVKVKFSDSYSGKREENFDNWETNVKTYVHLQQVSPDQQVLIAIHALRDEAANFARSLVRAANCSDDPVVYSSFTSLIEFLKLLRERFADVARSVKASDRLQTIHSRQWKSARALKGIMDELVAVPDHKVTETQLVNLFYRAMPETLRGHFFDKSQDLAMTYDILSREVVAFEAKSASISTFWHKDLDKGKKWKGRTISGQVKTKDSLVLTLDEGSVDEIPYHQIEWGFEEEDSSVGQGRTYAAVAAGGGRKEDEAKAKGAGPQGAGSRAIRELAAEEGTAKQEETPTPHVPTAEVAGRCLDSCPETVCVRVPLDTSLTGVAEELKERRPAWAKMKKENKGQLILLDAEIFRSRVGALVDSGANRSYISKQALQKLRLGLKVQKLTDPIVSILADNRTMVVEDYVEGVQAYFRLEKDGKVEKVLHSLTLLVEDSLPFDIVLGMDWGEAAGATLHLKEHECRLPSSAGEAKTARLFHVSGVENSLAHCCLSAPAFARLVKKEKLEEQLFVAYVRPVTEPTDEKPMDLAIAKLLDEFKDLTEPPTGTVLRPIQHRIEKETGSRTPKGAVYRMSPRELEELRKQLDELLEKGWIRPSSSPFGASVLFVPKKEGELRMCIDYRGLNAITVKNVEPLPRIDDLLDRVQGAKYFSKIDLKSGYHQIEVHPDDQYKTAFQTRYGHYEFIVIPFGLTNAPATFQRCMNDFFRPWLDKFVVVYLDDILVFSRTLEEHQGHLRQVLEKLREANFKINAKKCDWAKTQVLYLGHVLDGDNVKPEDSKIVAIRDWPTPRTLTELCSFLGLANYYRKFVRKFSTIAAPLRRLLRKETIWKWDKDCTFAMKKLKQALIEYPVLKVADPSLPFVITTDASQYGIGALPRLPEAGSLPREMLPRQQVTQRPPRQQSPRHQTAPAVATSATSTSAAATSAAATSAGDTAAGDTAAGDTAGAVRGGHDLPKGPRGVDLGDSWEDSVGQFSLVEKAALQDLQQGVQREPEACVGELQVARTRRPGRQMGIKRFTKNPRQEEIDNSCCEFFVENAIPFNAAKSRSFKKFTLACYGPQPAASHPLVPTGYNPLRYWLLDRLNNRLQEEEQAIRDDLQVTGCTFITDGTTDICGRSLMNYILACREWGVEKITVVCTDSFAGNTSIARMLREDPEFSQIYWIPCTAHYMDLLMHDLCKKEWAAEIISKANRVVNFFRAHRWPRSTLRTTLVTFPDLKCSCLLRPAATRFGTHYVMLQRLEVCEKAIRRIVTGQEWEAQLCRGDIRGKASFVEEAVLDRAFWADVKKLTTVTKGPYNVLREVDKDVHCLSRIYDMVCRLPDFVRSAPLTAEQRDDMLRDVGNRTDMLLSPIHAVARLLDPQLRDITFGRGVFGTPQAKKRVAKDNAVLWWEAHRAGHPEIRELAIRVLSIWTTSSPAERNWSTWALVQTKWRNKLHHQRTNKLVSSHWSLRLKSKGDEGPMIAGGWLGLLADWEDEDLGGDLANVVEAVDDYEHAVGGANSAVGSTTARHDVAWPSASRSMQRSAHAEEVEEEEEEEEEEEDEEEDDIPGEEWVDERSDSNKSWTRRDDAPCVGGTRSGLRSRTQPCGEEQLVQEQLVQEHQTVTARRLVKEARAGRVTVPGESRVLGFRLPGWDRL